MPDVVDVLTVANVATVWSLPYIPTWGNRGALSGLRLPWTSAHCCTGKTGHCSASGKTPSLNMEFNVRKPAWVLVGHTTRGSRCIQLPREARTLSRSLQTVTCHDRARMHFAGAAWPPGSYTQLWATRILPAVSSAHLVTRNIRVSEALCRHLLNHPQL